MIHLSDIKIEYTMKHISYLFFEFKKMYSNIDAFQERCHQELNDLCNTRLYLMNYAHFIFNESIWPPDRPETYEKLMKVQWTMRGRLGYIGILLDFTKMYMMGCFKLLRMV